MNNTVRFIKNWLPALLWICCIFILSTGTFSADNTYRILEPVLRFFMPHITVPEVKFVHFLIRKAAHITEYCIGSLLLFHSFRNTMRLERPWLWVLYSLIIIVLVAASDEYHQAFIVSRTSSVFDVGFDSLGGILGQGMSMVFYKMRYTRKKIKQQFSPI